MSPEARDMLEAVERIIDAIRAARLTAAALDQDELAGFLAKSEAQYAELQEVVRAAVTDYEAKTTAPS
jgi:hypothetical protein